MHNCTIVIIFHSVGDLSMESVDQIILKRRKTGQVFTILQYKELIRSFLNNSNLTKEVKIDLSNRLGLPVTSVVKFFKKQNRKPINESIAMYSKLLQSEK